MLATSVETHRETIGIDRSTGETETEMVTDK
jgi:hypothetical protein